MLAIWARLSENGENAAALRVLQEARKLYGDPPLPKKVRAEVEGYRLRHDSVCDLHDRPVMSRATLRALAALDARADAAGMVVEGTPVPPAAFTNRDAFVQAVDTAEATPARLPRITWEQLMAMTEQVFPNDGRLWHVGEGLRRMRRALDVVGIEVVP